jgi:hypothetical protein
LSVRTGSNKEGWYALGALTATRTFLGTVSVNASAAGASVTTAVIEEVVGNAAGGNDDGISNQPRSEVV